MIVLQISFMIAALLVCWSAWSIWAINRRFPPDGRKIPVAGRRIHVIEGQPASSQNQANAPLLLVHGAASNARELPSALGSRLAGWRWIAPDRPGLGHSERGGGSDRLGIQASILAEVITQAFPGEKVIAVGHSWGSAVSLRLALDRPDLVAGLVLLAPASHPWGGTTNLPNRLAVLPVFGLLLSWLLPPALGPLLAQSGIAKGFAPGPVRPPDYGKRIGTPLYFRPASFRANASDMVAADTELAAQAPRYGELAMPVTIISGQGDRIVSNTIHAKALKAAIAHATSIKVPDGGHMPHWVDPDLVVHTVRNMQATTG
jgi:pimeloyl-ACP methyl ester carboxylesterase